MVCWTCIPMAKRRTLAKLQCSNLCGSWWPRNQKDVKVNAIQLVNDVLENVEKRVSNWCKLKRIITLVLIYLKRLLLKVHRKKGMVEMTASYDIVSVTQSFPDLNSVQMAESLIIKSSRGRYFSNEMKILEEKGILNKKNSIYKLDSCLDRYSLTESWWLNSKVYCKWGNETSSAVSNKKWNCCNDHQMVPWEGSTLWKRHYNELHQIFWFLDHKL